MVANHPNSLVDPAILIHLLPRRIRFGARHGLFRGPLRPILEALGAIPLYRLQDTQRAQRQNLVSIASYVDQLSKGRVTAIFPEGYSHDEPYVDALKTGAARIALQAEKAQEFKLDLSIVPVGLQFEPRRRFRADAFVRFGEPFTFTDLAERYQMEPRQAIRALTERIELALKKLAYHLDSGEHTPLVERVVDIYLRRVVVTGLAGVNKKGLRGELLFRVADCLNHYLRQDPAAVKEIEEALERYEQLRVKAGARRRLLEDSLLLLPGPLAIVQGAAEAIFGAPIALFGFITGSIPYFLTKYVARNIVARSKHPPSFSISHILAGAIAFPLVYTLEIIWVWRHFSDIATLTFAVLLVPAGVFALAYGDRIRKLAVHLGGRISAWMKLGEIAQAVQARDELIKRLDQMRDRYRVEVLGWQPVTTDTGVRWLRLVPLIVTLASLLLLVFYLELRDRRIVDLQTTSSPWHELRKSPPDILNVRMKSAALGIIAAIAELERMETRMHQLREDFIQARRSYYTQADQDSIHQLLLTYLNLRTALLRTIWVYRGSYDDPADGKIEARAFLLAYSSAAVLFEKATAIVETFRDDQWAQKNLNQGDLTWELPEGTYDRLLANLSNADVLSELKTATDRFGRLQSGQAYAQPPWDTLARVALGAQGTIEKAVDQIDQRKLGLALRRMNQHMTDPVHYAQVLISTWIGDFRLKDRPRHRGLISPEQVKELKLVLEPGDILLERRNWFLSNAFLPGFWPHTALYLGTPQQLERLETTSDPQVAEHWQEFLGQDSEGHSYAVIEAISEGVVFTSLEHSVGEADAIAVLRPRLGESQRREALIRAFSHLGKPYDFQFDFFSTHRLVCSEVVYRAYAGMLDLPLTNIMGRLTLPVNTFVELYAGTRNSDKSAFELVLFLDMDEKRGCAVEATEEAFLETRDRSRFTFFQSR